MEDDDDYDLDFEALERNALSQESTPDMEEGFVAIDCGGRCISSGALVARTGPRGTSRPGPDQLSHRCEVSPQPPAPCVHAARRVLFCRTEMCKSIATAHSDGYRPMLHPAPAAHDSLMRGTAVRAQLGRADEAPSGEGVARSRGLTAAISGPCRDAEGTLATCPVPNTVQS